MADTTPTSGSRSRFNIVFNALCGVIVVACLSITSYAAKETVANRERIAKIEANRFNNDDGLEVWMKIAELQKSIAAIPNQPPPAWLVARVDRIEAKLDELIKAISDSSARR